MQMNGRSTQQQAQAEREKYVLAFNDTMLKIWQEQITLLDVIDTHSLACPYRRAVLRGRLVPGLP